jgi:hypothetical protein
MGTVLHPAFTEEEAMALRGVTSPRKVAVNTWGVYNPTITETG